MITPRTGLCRRRLRSPLLVDKMGHPNPPETGILSSNGASPLVSVKGGTVSADERLRIQAVLDNYASLKKLVHDQYGGRLADVLDVKLA